MFVGRLGVFAVVAMGVFVVVVVAAVVGVGEVTVAAAVILVRMTVGGLSGTIMVSVQVQLPFTASVCV
jgi:hypothetical protein